MYIVQSLNALMKVLKVLWIKLNDNKKFSFSNLFLLNLKNAPGIKLSLPILLKYLKTGHNEHNEDSIDANVGNKKKAHT